MSDTEGFVGGRAFILLSSRDVTHEGVLGQSERETYSSRRLIGVAYRWYSDRQYRVNGYSRAHAFFSKGIEECLPQESLFFGLDNLGCTVRVSIFAVLSVP